MGRARHTAALAVVFLLLSAPWAHAAKEIMAILSLRPTNIEAMGHNGEVLYALVSALERKKTVELVPRREMEEILYQAGLVQGDTAQMALKAGKVLGVNFVVFGRVTKAGSQIRTQLNLLDVRRNHIVHTWQPVFAGREDILNRMPGLADELGRAIRREKRQTAAAAAEAPAPQVRIGRLEAARSGTKVVLRWAAEGDQAPVGFNVYRSEKREGPYQFVGQTQSPVFEDIPSRADRSYFYRIGILSAAGGEIKDTQTAEIVLTTETMPYPPLILGGDAHIRHTVIKFVPSLRNAQAKIAIDRYHLYRKSPPADQWRRIGEMEARKGSQFDLTLQMADRSSLDDGGTYLYAIASVGSKNRESPLSDPLALTTVARPQLAMVQDSPAAGGQLQWPPVPGAAGYHIYRRDSAGDWHRIGRVEGGDSRSFTDEAAAAAASPAAYYITAFDARGETGPSNEVALAAPAASVPQPPADVMVQSGLFREVRVTWTRSEDPNVGGYVVFRGLKRQALKEIVRLQGRQTRVYLDRGDASQPLEDGRVYHYAVAATDIRGIDGPATATAAARTKPGP